MRWLLASVFLLMYSVKALLGAERKIIGEEDNQGDAFILELP